MLRRAAFSPGTRRGRGVGCGRPGPPDQDAWARLFEFPFLALLDTTGPGGQNDTRKVERG
jgi:hypothetical protein